MSRRQPKILQGQAAQQWRDRLQQENESRKLPVTTKAQREAIPDDWSSLREKMKECMAQIERATREASKQDKPPAPAWRSIASAPNPGVDHLAALWIDEEVVIKVGSVYTTEHWRAESGDGYPLSDVLAWAPIPEWTGEVAE